ncbi:unnamed protein product [Larinioides sclopetarius]|uniref:lysozyme n=1 Tax=Larinioides sclopetarius TaxID=280406 RepID=A0AAV2A0F3_9ARAC
MDLMPVTSNTPTCDFFRDSHWYVEYLQVSLEVFKTGTAITRALHPVYEDRNLLLIHIHRKVMVSLPKAQFPKRTKKVPEVDQRCMECICQAVSNCDKSLKCYNAGDSAYYCGPYAISWAYWHDGGRPGYKGRAHDFETCLNNKTCAEQAVRGYMRRYGRDCDRNGVIDCTDFARIHKLGFGQCSSDSIIYTDYWQKFEFCYIGHAEDKVPSNNGKNKKQPRELW